MKHNNSRDGACPVSTATMPTSRARRGKPRLYMMMFLLLGSQAAQAQVRPDSALMRTDPYRAIYEAQSLAIALDTDVDYSAWRDSLIRMTIPPDPKPIPLTWENDFCNMVLEVTNTEKDFYLFSKTQPASPIEVTPAQVDSGYFPQLGEGRFMLILKDENPWTFREGFGYNVYRQDLLCVENGKAWNRPVQPYSTPSTKMKASVVSITQGTDAVFQNLHLRRTPESTHQTRLVSLSNMGGIYMENLSVATPQYHTFHSRVIGVLPPSASTITSRTRTPNKLEHDGVIAISNCYDIHLDNVVIDGTYTVPGSYGYALSVNNTFDANFSHIYADANWGVFGSNNMSHTELSACLLNRFDIHCYGRDVYAENCTFFGKQTQFSSFYGKLIFHECLFDDCIPVRIRGDYNAHTPFDIYMYECTFRPSMKYHHLVNVILTDTARNPRPELSERHLPTLHVRNLKVEKPPLVPKVKRYHLTGNRRAVKEAQGLIPRQ